MSTFSTDLAAMARSMQDFFDAMGSRCEMSVSDAVYMLETIHGENAPIMAVVMAYDSVDDPCPAVTRFWMQVYAALIAPTHADPACPVH